MAFKFPFTNYHELNLTWVLEQLKKLFEESEENVETIEGYENRLSAVEDELPVVEATAEQAATVANAAATLAQTAKSTADTANENALTASSQAGLARQEAADAEAEAQAATQAAQQVQAIVQDFDGRITQAEDDASEALQEAQSFENRVNAAINTANNAANTATIAQGIAVNANQNAATALDTAQTADGKAEAAQDAADIADGKAEAAQDAAEAAQDTADQNADNIGNLADLTTTAKNNLVAAINEAAQTGGGTDDTKAPLIVSEASGVVASFSDGANNMNIQELVCTIEPVQAGTGDPTPTNIRPISGHNGMKVTRTGKNLLEMVSYNGMPYNQAVGTQITISKSQKQYVDNGDGSFTVTGLGSWEGVGLIVPVKKAGTYNVSMQVYGRPTMCLYAVNNNFVTIAAARNAANPVAEGAVYSYSWELQDECKYLLIYIGASNDSIITIKNPIVQYNEVITTYEPFGITLPISWQTEAGTVYFGFIDVISGKLTATHKMYEFDGTESGWVKYSTQTIYNTSLCSDLQSTASYINGICSHIGQLSSSPLYIDPSKVVHVNAGVGIQFNALIDDYGLPNNDVATWMSYLAQQKANGTPLQILGALKNPIVYTIISNKLTTLYGVNNVFTDVGAIQSCKYPADTKLYIDGKVTELQALILEN